jgi:hypothetical protein
VEDVVALVVELEIGVGVAAGVICRVVFAEMAMMEEVDIRRPLIL